MTTLMCTHHNGIIVYDQFGNQQVIGGQGQTTEFNRVAAQTAPPPAAPATIAPQPLSLTQMRRERTGGDAAKAAVASANVAPAAVSMVSLTPSQLQSSPALRDLINSGVLTIVG